MKQLQIIGTLVSICLFAVSASAMPTPALVGTAVDSNTNELLYKEKHLFETQNGQPIMRSEFLDPNGVLIAERTVKYDGGTVKEYRFKQDIINYSESIIRSRNRIDLEGQNGDEIKSDQIDDDTGVIIDAGFSDYIVRNWDELNQGKTKRFKFAHIGQMDAIKLRVKKAEIENTSAVENGVDDNVVMFKMTLANPVLRLLVKPIEVGYYKDSKQLAYYQGISNLKNSDGKQFSSVRIQYENKQVTQEPSVGT